MTALRQASVRQRTCVGCRRVASSDALVRLTYQAGRVEVAAPHPAGRGAWLCPANDCLERAGRRRALERALRTRVSIDYDLRRRFTDVCEQRKAVR